ncbi:MAG TPA: hypothetical protein VM260_13115 [Pirellula sp.]|nr:hypothetical protein [Pirellula sp.]
MKKSSIDKHRQDLHDAFFQERDQELLDFLRFESETAEEQEREQLQTMAGISDPFVLDALDRVGVTSASMTAFMLLPLVRLAWADSKIQNSEFDSLLKAATEDGIAYGTPAYRLLNRWLEERPTEKMLDAWWKYAQALARELDDTSLEEFRKGTLGRARRLAEASGGILGLGERISENERHVLNDIANALTKPKA